MDDRTPPAGELPRFYTHPSRAAGVVPDFIRHTVYERVDAESGIRFLAVELESDIDFVVAALNAAADREKAGSLV